MPSFSLKVMGNCRRMSGKDRQGRTKLEIKPERLEL